MGNTSEKYGELNLQTFNLKLECGFVNTSNINNVINNNTTINNINNNKPKKRKHEEICSTSYCNLEKNKREQKKEFVLNSSENEIINKENSNNSLQQTTRTYKDEDRRMRKARSNQIKIVKERERRSKMSQSIQELRELIPECSEKRFNQSIVMQKAVETIRRLMEEVTLLKQEKQQAQERAEKAENEVFRLQDIIGTDVKQEPLSEEVPPSLSFTNTPVSTPDPCSEQIQPARPERFMGIGEVPPTAPFSVPTPENPIFDDVYFGNTDSFWVLDDGLTELIKK